MKRTHIKIIFAFVILLLSSGALFAENEKLKVFVSILPQKYFAEKLLANNGEVNVLIGAGMSPHTYEPLPQQMSKLSRADMFFTVGIPFEKVIISRLKNLCPNLVIVQTDENIEKIKMAGHHHHEEPHEHHHEEAHKHEMGLDPHFWLDPIRTITMAENMAKAITVKRPDLADSIKANLESIKSEMNQLDTELTQKLLSFKGKTMLVFHPAFGYFANRYGMVQKAVEIEGKEPAPRQLAELIRNCRAEGIKVIFVQKQFPLATAETISRSIGGRVVAIDPLAEDYVNNLKAMAEAVTDSAK
ncbi:MAG: zinc ABC transporter substrate-binding protein [Candidatus Riflebacteria bacterium]|nr:zinc ABC transporter substrate-binding protein [Candidatus Riflebacteria bacterium]